MEFSPKYNLVSQNRIILNILERIEKISDSDCSILLIGETGVGKEVFAEFIHRSSARNHHPLIKVGMSSLPANLIESELFGHVKGAFTSSDHEKKGQFELANGGTLFLDDIDDFPLELQPKLLRVLESKEVMRIGAQQATKLDIRLITASKLDLGDLVAKNKFRMDLYYRINVFPIYIPPLRERADDIPYLVEYFLKKYEPDRAFKVSEEVIEVLQSYAWPGNVREMRNVIQRVALFANGEINLDNLPSEIKSEKGSLFFKSCAQCFKDKKMAFEDVIACVESHLIQNAIKNAGGNLSQAARTLGLSLSTFRDKMKKHNLDHAK